MLSLRILTEKYMEKRKKFYVVFMALEKAYDSVDRNAMRMGLRQCYKHCCLLEVIKSLLEGIKCCAKVEEAD